MKNLRFLGVFLGLILGFMACEGQMGTGTPVTTLPSPSSTTPHLQLSLSPTRRPTNSPSPSYTLTPTATETPTITPTPTVTPTGTPLGCWRLGGRILTGSLETKLLRTPLGYRVYLPPCYTEQAARCYPVLYLFHGQSYTDDQWDRLGANEMADKLIASGEVSPFMIVMPYERYGGQPTESNFAQAVVEILIPYVDRTFRTLPERDYRAVGGLSRGGGWAVHLAFSKWEYFGALGAHSPAIFHTDSPRLRTWLKAIPPDSLPRIFIDIGDKDRPEIMETTLWFENLLNDLDIPHEWHMFSGYHAEEYWHAHIELYLRWYAQNW